MENTESSPTNSPNQRTSFLTKIKNILVKKPTNVIERRNTLQTISESLKPVKNLKRNSITKKTTYNLEDFKILGLINKGSYGIVLLAELNGEKKAIKCIHKSYFLNRCSIHQLKDEKKIMLQTKSPFVTCIEGRL